MSQCSFTCALSGMEVVKVVGFSSTSGESPQERSSCKTLHLINGCC